MVKGLATINEEIYRGRMEHIVLEYKHYSGKRVWFPEFLSAKEQIISFFLYIRLTIRAEGTWNSQPAQNH